MTGRRILVTGASAGIGAELARAFVANDPGVRLVLAARRREELEALAADCRARGAQATALTADLSTSEGVDALARAALAPYGGIDVLINNAGVEALGPIWRDGLADEGERLLRLNVHAPLRLTHRLVPAMRARGAGAVVYIASVAAMGPFPEGNYYAASKAALSSAAESIALELRGSGVRVLTVYPGPVKTRMYEAVDRAGGFEILPPGHPVGVPDELARRIVAALAAGEERLFYPSFYVTSSWLPALTRRMVEVLDRRRRRATR